MNGKKVIVIIGFGSSGRRNYNILRNNKKVKKIYIVSSQNKVPNKVKLQKINEIDPDIILVCSTTDMHYRHYQYINKNLKKKIVLIEKPLFSKIKNISNPKNIYLVSYNLRFHPLIEYVKKFIKGKKILSTYIYCGSNALLWRKGTPKNKVSTFLKKKV